MGGVPLTIFVALIGLIIFSILSACNKAEGVEDGLWPILAAIGHVLMKLDALCLAGVGLIIAVFLEVRYLTADALDIEDWRCQ
jgi:hypothetical protein